MTIERWTCAAGTLAVLLLAAGCEDPRKPLTTFVLVESGSQIGVLDTTYFRTKADAAITVVAQGGRLEVSVASDQGGSAQFQLPSGVDQIEVGTYEGLQLYPFRDPAVGWAAWSGAEVYCSALEGSFSVNAVQYVDGALHLVDVTFEGSCQGGSALRGHVHWDADDPTLPPGPVNPPPTGLWRPAAGSVPATGNYVHLESEAGDLVGRGTTYTYTQADAILTVNGWGGYLGLRVQGDENWWGDFQAMYSLDALQPGFYGGLNNYQMPNPARGGLHWWGTPGSCSSLDGWFVVDHVAYGGAGELTAIDLRFEQRCDGMASALHGQIHWRNDDPTAPPGPVDPPPTGLWEPAPGATPASGNYVYVESELGDVIGAGLSHLYTSTNSFLSVVADWNQLLVGINGDEIWNSSFQTMVGLTALQPGYYGHLEHYPWFNPAHGGPSWSSDGRACGTVAGWVVVDAVTYVGNALDSIDARFEQHCDGAVAALRGKIHWAAP